MMAKNNTRAAKDEIIALKLPYCCEITFLSALLRAGGSLVRSLSEWRFEMVSENVALLKFASTMLFRRFKIRELVTKAQGLSLKGNDLYILKISDSLVLKTLELLTADGSISFEINDRLLEKKCCKDAYIAGCFVGCGSVNFPQLKSEMEGDDENKAGYHLECVFSREELKNGFCGLLTECGIFPKSIIRKGQYVVYLKDSDSIVNFLFIIKANEVAFLLTDIIAERSISNIANRQSNFETNNYDKIVSASANQIRAIVIIDQVLGISELGDKLKELAQLRLNLPEMDLAELGKLLNPPLSKGGVNYRMNKILSIAKELEE